MKHFAQCSIASLALISAPLLSAGELEVRATLTKAVPALKISSVEKSEIAGLYRVESLNSPTLYTNEDASFFLAGDMFSIANGQVNNLSEVRREHSRAEKIAAIKPEEKIVFAPKGETKAKIAVFTDIDCGYCRKLHQEIPRMNELGIEVSYLAYPRAGVGSPSYDKIVSAWCSDDKLQALTDAKAGKAIPAKICANPVAKQFELGQELGVSGTPAIVLQDGVIIPGYLTADKLAQTLGIL